MARVTARQAFTRSKTKRMKEKADADRAIIEARRRYVRQLSTVGIQVEGGSQSEEAQQPVVTRKSRRQSPSIGTKKITDYFAATKKLEFSPRLKQPLKTTVCRDPNGIECVTIYDSDTEIDASRQLIETSNADENHTDENRCENNNHPGACDANINSTSDGSTSGFWDTSSDSGNSARMADPSSSSGHDVKPQIAKLSFQNLGVSFEELQLKIRVEDDIEIVDILPPIPLRKHEVFDIEG